MGKINYPRVSPYVDTPQGSWYIGNYHHRSIPRGENDTQITISPDMEFRPEKLALKLYGTEGLWWVFMARNLNIIRDPVWDFTAGLTIWVPTLAFLKSRLGV